MSERHDDYWELKFYELAGAVRALYMAAHWSPDRECNAARLWEDVRDAADLPKGKSPKPLTPAQGER